MNNIKFRPVGTPSAPITVVKVTQNKGSMYLHRGVSKAQAEKVMLRKGYIRVGVRA